MASRVQIQGLARGTVTLGATGAAVPNARVRIYASGTTSTVTVYRDPTGGATLTQPLKTDHLGDIPGYLLPMQIVDISVNGGPVTQVHVPAGNPSLADLADGLAWIAAIQAGSGGTFSRLEAFGQSLAAGAAAFNNHGFNDKIATMLGIPNVSNRALGGAAACFHDRGLSGDGGYATVISALRAMRLGRVGPYGPASALVSIYYGFNDGFLYGTLTPTGWPGAIPNWTSAMRAMISTARAASILEYGDSHLVVGGSGGPHWAGASFGLEGNLGNTIFTATNGDTIRFTVPADVTPGATVALVGLARDNAQGSAIAWTKNGSAAGNTSMSGVANQYAAGGHGEPTNVWCKRFTANPGDVIVGTFSGLGGGVLGVFLYALIEASPPPLIVLPSTSHPATTNTNPYGASSTAALNGYIDQFNVALQALITEFDSSCVYVDTNAALGNGALANYAPDLLHWSEKGHANVAAAARAALISAAPAGGSAAAALFAVPVAPTYTVTLAAGANAGTGAPAPTQFGTGLSEYIGWGTGTTPSPGAQVGGTLSAPFDGFPHFTPDNPATAALGPYVVSVLDGRSRLVGFTIGFMAAPAASQPAGTYAGSISITAQ